MPDYLIPVGTHFFTPVALDAALSRAIPSDVGPNGGASIALDTDGVKVALIWTSHDQKIRIRGAYSHGLDGQDKVAGDVLFRF